MANTVIKFFLFHSKVCEFHFGNEICTDLYSNPEELSQVQEEASYWIRLSSICMLVPSIVVDCFLGSWSDIFGRRITLVLPPIGAFLGNFVYIALLLTPKVPGGVAWICLASLFQGAFGSFSSVFTGKLNKF